MRLISLYIEEYKNIKNQTFDFSGNTGYIALIGLNGSGKSNLLEAIGLIFNGLLNNQKIPFVYETKYEHDGKIYLRKPYVAMIDGNKVKEAEMLYPSSVIACYSGEDLRLWHMAFENYYLHYFSQAIKNRSFSPRLVYINKECWKIAFIALLCSEKASVKSFLKDCLHLDDLTSVNCAFSFDDKKKAKFTEHQALKWFNRIENLQKQDKEGVVNANTIRTIDMSLYGVTQPQLNSKFIFQFLYLLSIPELNREKGQDVDKIITNITISIGNIKFDGLSEGEKKMILIECITQVLSDDASIVLLDEPDAYVHIALKHEILNCINNIKCQVLLTTHSPVFVNQMAENNIYPIHEGTVLNQEKRALIQKIANNEISVIDSACIVSSKYVIVTEGPDDIYHIKAAVSAVSNNDVKFISLEQFSYLFMGGAREVDNFFNEILKSLYDTVTRIVFVFDYDEDGREGAKVVRKLIDNGNDKLKYVFYHKQYPVPAPDLDFYLEDFFERTAYNDVQLPVINGVPSFSELKKATTLAKSIKNRIQKHKRENSLTPNDYNGFKGFLEQLFLQIQ